MGQRALNVLVSCMEDDDAPWPARVQAAAHVADRAYGKPRQAVDLDINGRQALAERLDRARSRVASVGLIIEHHAEAEACPPLTTTLTSS